MITFYAIVVLYNTSINESVTISNLSKIHSHNIKIIAVDNSTIGNNNASIADEKKYIYLDMHGNVGLSKAYNHALDYLSNKEGVVIWFDDDTNVTQEYFDVLEESVNRLQTFDIFVPVIQGQDGHYWSPNEAHFFRNKQLKSQYQVIDADKINAINSCTAVRLSVYSNYRYDERLFLDQVDHKFFQDQRSMKRNIHILDTVIHHHFSTKSKMSNIEAVKTRYSIMIPDFLMYSKLSNKLFLGTIKVAGWGVREGIKYKNSCFFFWTMKETILWVFKRRV